MNVALIESSTAEATKLAYFCSRLCGIGKFCLEGCWPWPPNAVPHSLARLGPQLLDRGGASSCAWTSTAAVQRRVQRC